MHIVSVCDFHYLVCVFFTQKHLVCVFQIIESLICFFFKGNWHEWRCNSTPGTCTGDLCASIPPALCAGISSLYQKDTEGLVLL